MKKSFKTWGPVFEGGGEGKCHNLVLVNEFFMIKSLKICFYPWIEISK